MRKLASLQEVSEIQPIFDKEGNLATSIELAIINGWQCVVKKEQFKKGDLAVYLEIDSFITDKNEVLKDFAKDLIAKNGRHYFDLYGLRVKTIKLLGELSQGLLVPLKDVKDVLLKQNISLEVDTDVTEALGIIKFDADLLKATNTLEASGSFPSFIQKTDCERIQNLTVKHLLTSSLMLEEFETTVKYDGSSMTVFVKGEETGICSRNQGLKLDCINDFTTVGLPVLEQLKLYCEKNGKNLALQGELIGPKINGNFEKVRRVEYHIFNIYDIDKQGYLSLQERLKIYDDLKILFEEANIDNVNFVKNITLPFKHFYEIIGFSKDDYLKLIENQKLILSTGTDEEKAQNQQYLNELVKTIRNFFLNHADGEGYLNNVREGIVMKTANGQFIWKAISNNYLLKEK